MCVLSSHRALVGAPGCTGTAYGEPRRGNLDVGMQCTVVEGITFAWAVDGNWISWGRQSKHYSLSGLRRRWVGLVELVGDTGFASLVDIFRRHLQSSLRLRDAESKSDKVIFCPTMEGG